MYLSWISFTSRGPLRDGPAKDTPVCTTVMGVTWGGPWGSKAASWKCSGAGFASGKVDLTLAAARDSGRKQC